MKVEIIILLFLTQSLLIHLLKLNKKDSTLLSLGNKARSHERGMGEVSDIAEEKGGDSDKIPIINVHMEEPDRDPIEVKRYEEERRIERNRIRDLEAREEMDKRAFQQIISLQTSQLAKLTNIAESTSNILKELASASTSQVNTMSVNQGNAFLETKDNVNNKDSEVLAEDKDKPNSYSL